MVELWLHYYYVHFVAQFQYTLTLTKQQHAAKEATLDDRVSGLVCAHVPTATILSSVGAELSFRLPLSDSAKFPALLEQLEISSESLGVASYGLGVTTMEDVFMQVAHKSSSSVSIKPSSAVEIDDEKERGASFDDTALDADKSYSGVWRQFLALMIKRLHNIKRDRRAFICQFFIPIFIIVGGLFLLSLQFSISNFNLTLSTRVYNGGNPTPVPFNTQYLDISGNTIQLPTVAAGFAALVNSPSSPWSNAFAVPTLLSDISIKSVSSQLPVIQLQYAGSQYGALVFGNNSKGQLCLQAVFSNSTAIHGLMTYISMGHNVLLRAAFPQDSRAGMVAHVWPFRLSTGQVQQQTQINSAFIAIVLVIGFCFIPSSYAVFVVKEREYNIKHLQQISGAVILNGILYFFSITSWRGFVKVALVFKVFINFVF